MKEAMMMNCVSVTVAALAIAVACKVTKSTLPLLAFAIVPTWKVSISTNGNGGN